MKEIIERGTTSVVRHVFIQDSSSTTGAGLTALAHDTASLAGAYLRDGGTLATLTFETIATLGTYAAPSSNAHIRIKLLHDTNAPGMYELQFHNDWFNTTGDKRSLSILLFGAANMAPIPIEFQLCDPVRGVGSPTALPAVAAEAAGGLYTRGSGAGQINQNANGQVDTNTVKISGSSTAADNAEVMYDDAITAAAVNDGSPSSTVFITTLTEVTDDHYNGSAIVFTSGVLKGQVRPVNDYAGGTKTITVSPAFTEAPANSDTFLILGRIS